MGVVALNLLDELWEIGRLCSLLCLNPEPQRHYTSKMFLYSHCVRTYVLIILFLAKCDPK